jgi:CheY-like chemotaxis protein
MPADARLTAPLHVLVADDNRSIADTTAELLAQSLGWVVGVAYDGGDCLRQACASRPDAVLLDLRMPVLGGLAVARRIRAHYPENPPYLVAMTGCTGEVDDLAAMDRVFDRVLAKPLDMDALCAGLQDLSRTGEPGANSVPARIDAAEVLTRAARKLAPLAAARGIDLGFDHLGDSILVQDDAVLLHRAFERIWLGMLDMVEGGSILLRSQSELRPSGSATLTVDATATGLLGCGDRVAAWLDDMDLRSQALVADSNAPSPLRQGRCPLSGAALSCWVDADQGLLLRATLQYTQASVNAAVGRPQVGPALAWLVATHVMPMAAEAQRLRRLGWTVMPMDTCEQALAALGTQAQPAAAPDLLVVFAEAPQTLAGLRALRQALPASTRCLLPVVNGHPWLGTPDSVPGYAVCTTPFSPLDLAGLCHAHSASLRQDAATPSPPRAADLGLDARPRVLVVDDGAVNRIVGRGLVEMLGYEVETAHDGLDAIDRCRRHPPACVLMDLDMPVLGGLDAAARLRDLQRAGELPLFPVIAATANTDAEAACHAVGMVGFLPKPMDLNLLRSLLRRFTDDVVLR